MTKNTTTYKELRSINTKKTIGAALALILAAPLVGGEKKGSEETEIEKQYSMVDGAESPKEAGVSTVGSEGEGSVQVSSDAKTVKVKEKQYSMNQPSENPKEADMVSHKEKWNKSEKSHKAHAQYGNKHQHAHSSTHHHSMSKGSAFNNQDTVDLTAWNGWEISSSDSERIGKVKDVVVDLNSGEATHLLVDNKGPFSGSRLVAISDFHKSEVKGELVAGFSKDEFEAMPKFEGRMEEGKKVSRENKMAYLHSNQLLCSDLIGEDVELYGGKDVGEIEGLRKAPFSSDIYVIVSDLEADVVSKDLNVDRFALRASKLKMDAEGDDLVVDLDSNAIETAPSISIDDAQSWQLYPGREVLIISTADDSYAVR